MPPIDARILVADDNEDVLQAARLLLKRHFTGVQTLSDPAHLASLARRGVFDVLLLDMNFSPGADSGAEGLKRLSEVLEIEETRTALRDEVLQGTLSPQLLVRIGWAPPQPLPATPRLPVDATIDGPRPEER